MSAIRTVGSGRSRSRQTPYARPAPKKASWSITSFFSYLNPLRSRSPVEPTSESQTSSDAEEFSNSQSSPRSSVEAESLSKRGHKMARDINTDELVNVEGPSSEPPWLSQQQPLYASTSFTPRAAPLHHNGHSMPPVSSSPAKNLETVKEFLTDRAGKPISEVEIEGLLSLIQKSAPVEEPEPFRFSSPTPSTPDRGVSPSPGTTNGFSFGFHSPVAQMSTPSRKILNKNPNGKYRWEGGGSAKAPRSRNRYSSPAFGPSRSASDRLILKDDNQASTEPPKVDAKRRRIGDDAATSRDSSIKVLNGNVPHTPARSPTPDLSPTRAKQALPFPVSHTSPATPRANRTLTPKSNGISTSPLLRVPQKPTAPVVPSPLRQAWSGGGSPQSDSSPSSTPHQRKQTNAANFLTELIKEVTPPRRPDLSNPYQTASPVNKVGAPSKSRVGKRVRATGRPAKPEIKEKTKEQDGILTKKEIDKVYSPQAIIEATLPKGSKRSRPPAHFEDRTSPPSNDASASSASDPPDVSRIDSRPKVVHKTPVPIVEEVVEDDDEGQPSKKSKPHLSGRGFASTIVQRQPATPPSSQDIVIEEIEDVDVQSYTERAKSVTPPSVSISSTSGLGSTPPSVTTTRLAFSGFKSTSAPKEPSKLRYSYQPEAGSSSASLELEEVQVSESKKGRISSKEAALSMPVESLPSFVFSVSTYFTNTSHTKVREDASLLPKSSLPTFDFSTQAQVTKPVPKSTVAPPVLAFNWAAAGVKLMGASGSGTNWTCSTCFLSNPATAIDKCTICESPR